MPNFKPKHTKKFTVNNKKPTLDTKHQQMNRHFDNNSIHLSELKEQKDELKSKLCVGNNLQLEQQLDIKDQIAEISKKIKLLNREKKDYWLNNSKHIFEYFENKQKISKCDNKTKKLDEFFNIKTNSYEQDSFKKKTDTSIQKYLSNVDHNYLDMNNYIEKSDICKNCNKGEMIPVDYEGIIICNNCSKSLRYLIENEKPSYKEPPKEVCFYAYRRINHFREILAQFQAKETTQIPVKVIEAIKMQIKKERITVNQINNKKAKEILKKLGYNKYCEHIPFIKDKLGIPPPIMTQELEETLCNLFMDIQEPYAKYCPDDRVNFLNYYYTIYKLCELLSQDQFLPYFPMLKDREKRIEQDEIWKQICHELSWQFFPTI